MSEDLKGRGQIATPLSVSIPYKLRERAATYWTHRAAEQAELDRAAADEIERLRSVIRDVVRIADESPFAAIGHVVEHALPKLRDLAATREALGDE